MMGFDGVKAENYLSLWEIYEKVDPVLELELCHLGIKSGGTLSHKVL